MDMTGFGSVVPRSDGAFSRRVAEFLAHNDDLLSTPSWTSGEAPVAETLRRLGDAGLLKAAATDSSDGAVPGCFRSAQLHEALASSACGAAGAAVLTHLEVGARLIAGKGGITESILEGMHAGKETVALAVTEPGGGSDLTAMSTRLGESGICGEKFMVTNLPVADWIIVLAVDTEHRTGKRSGPALLLVDAADPGVTVSTLETRSNAGFMGAVTLQDASVAAVLAPAGLGLLALVRHLLHERVMLSVRLSALAARALRQAVAETSSRHRFGDTLIKNQHLHYRLAEEWARLQSTRALVRYGLRQLARRSCTPSLAAMCKLHAAETARAVTETGVRFAGATGYRLSHPAPRLLADAIGLSLAGGADEVLLEHIDPKGSLAL